MKKLFALLLVLVLLVCAFSGCTSNEEVIPTESKPVVEAGGLYAEMSLEELFETSGEGVFYGKIVKVSEPYDYTWDIGEGCIPIEMVFTKYTVEVEKVYKGESKTRKIEFHVQAGEGSKVIVKNEVSKDYKVGYQGVFFLRKSPNGVPGHPPFTAPYFEVKDGAVTVPSYVTLPKELASKDGNTTFTVEQFGEILAGYAK